jgi:hypothetical protein
VECNTRFAVKDVVAVSLHPGVIDTDIWRHTSTVMKMNKSIEQGAATTVYCAVCPTLKPAAFYSDCKEATPAAYAVDETNAKRLWEISVTALNAIV